MKRLRWEHDFSRKGFSVEEGRKKGREPPQWYLDEPPVTVEMALMMDAFRELGTTRDRQMSDVGMIVGPIPWDKISTYLDRMGFDDVNAEVAWYAIRALDNEYLSMERDRLEAAAEKQRRELKRAAKGRG